MRRSAIERFLLWARDEMVDTQGNGDDKLELAMLNMDGPNIEIARRPELAKD